jgi:DNA-binding protein HU-beta
MNVTLDLTSIAEMVREANPDVINTKLAAKGVTQSVFDAIVKAVQNGDSVRIYGFGIFSVTNRAARKGRNPRTGEPLDIPASSHLKFSPSKATKKGVLA